MTKVFISYNRADVEFAQRLRDTVRSAGHTPWLDIDDIPKGAYWPDAIDEGLEASNAVVGVMTPESVESRNVKNEWDWALSNDKPLLLVMLRTCKVPHRYISINYVDFSKGEEQGFAQLRSALADPTKPLYHDDDVHVGTQHVVYPPTHEPTKPADKNRSRMLTKVREFWVKGVLENSLHGAVLLELGMEKKPESVERAWDAVLQHSDYEDFSLPRGTKIADVFDDLGGELLILGDPGSGKTTTLLELARDLIARAEADETLPMPVVFNLSSWAEERKPLVEWLVDELNTKYQVPKKIGKEWVENDRILPLLDGLDEVKQEYRDASVDTINTFRQEHGFVNMVVCSRIADYEALTKKLRLQGAIVLQPLELGQVDDYLARAGEGLAAVRSVLDDDEKLQELVTSPLMLSIVALAYRGTTLEDFPQFDTLEGRRKHLFNAYVDRMLKRRGADERYTEEQTVHWLAWLARQMSKHAQSVFYIEGLQPNWILGRSLRLCYRIVVGLGSSLFFELFFVLVTGTLFWCTTDGESWGLEWNWYGVIQGSGLAFVLGLILTLRLAVFSDEIRIAEAVRLAWKRRELASGIVLGSLVGLVIMFRSYTNPLAQGLLVGIAIALAFGLKRSEKVETRIRPNQGIRRSALAGVRVAVAYGLTLGVAFMLIASPSCLPLVLLLAELLLIVGFIGVFAGLLVGGADAVIKHFVLRVILYRSGDAPLNYAAFLDYAASRVLLRKVGGGYIFIHRLLLNYFAELELAKSKNIS